MADKPGHDPLRKGVLEYRTQRKKGLSAKDRVICAMLAGVCWIVCAFPAIMSIQFGVHGDYLLCLLCFLPTLLTGYWAVYFTLRAANVAQPRMDVETVDEP